MPPKMTYYQIFAQVYPGQYSRVLVNTSTFRVQAPTLPDPSWVSIGNFHTLRRYFSKADQARKWADHLHAAHAKGRSKIPSLTAARSIFLRSLQNELF
jgi:hypothetical protein